MRLLGISLLAVASLAVPAVAVAAASPHDPVLHARAADVSLAKSLLLATADLPPGFRDVGPDHSSSGNKFDCPGIAEPDLHSLVMTADVTSHDLRLIDHLTGFTQVSTEAALFRSAADARKSIAWFAALPKARLSACVARGLRASLPKNSRTSGLNLAVNHLAAGDLHLDIWEMRVRIQVSGRWILGDMLIVSLRRDRITELLTAVNDGVGLDPSLVADISRTIRTRLELAPL